MLSELANARKVVGLKQSRRALKDGNALRVYLARDADDRVLQPVRAACDELSVEVVWTDSMAELGKACGVDIGAAAVAILKPE